MVAAAFTGELLSALVDSGGQEGRGWRRGGQWWLLDDTAGDGFMVGGGEPARR